MRIQLSRVVLAIFVLTLAGPSLLAQQTQKFSSSAELDQLLAAKESGLLTDWRLIGPFGNKQDFSQKWQPEQDQLRKQRYSTGHVINLQFPAGKFELPIGAAKRGIFYASSEVWLPNGGDWRLYAETAGQMIVFLDGKPAIHRVDKARDLQTTSEVVHLERGTHRVLVKFTAGAAPFHLAVMPQTGGLRKRNNKPNVHIAPESEYTSAELHWPR